MSYKAFEHRGKPMTKKQVKCVLEYGLQMKLKLVSQLTNAEIDEIIDKVNHGRF